MTIVVYTPRCSREGWGAVGFLRITRKARSVVKQTGGGNSSHGSFSDNLNPQRRASYKSSWR